MDATIKAEQLIEKFAPIMPNGHWHERARQCAIVSVDEIIKALKVTTDHCELRKLDQQEVQMDFDYWTKVKHHLEKL